MITTIIIINNTSSIKELNNNLSDEILRAFKVFKNIKDMFLTGSISN